MLQTSEDEGTSAALDKLYWSSAIVITYDVTNKHSYSYACSILEDIKHERPQHACLLLGNKIDLEHQRDVENDEAASFVSKFTNCIHMELSAATSDHSDILDIFRQLSTLSRFAASKSSTGIKRRRSIVDMAKAFGTMLRSGSSKSPDGKL